MKNEIYERRLEMLLLHREGLTVIDLAQELAPKYNISEEAVKRDWSRRRNWMQDFVRIDEPIELVNKMIVDNEVLFQDSQNLYQQAESTSLKVQILWLQLKIQRERKSMLKEMGAFEPIQKDYNFKARDRFDELIVEREPYRKGEEDRKIRKRALDKWTQHRAYFDSI